MKIQSFFYGLVGAAMIMAFVAGLFYAVDQTAAQRELETVNHYAEAIR